MVDEFTNEDGETLPVVKPAGVALMFEAKNREDRPFTTLLSKEMFEELIKFEQWLYFEVLYNDVPGIPMGSNNYTEYPR